MLRSAQNATIAKARAMWGKRLLDSDYTRLMNLGSVSDAAEYLKEHTHFAPALSGVDTASIHRGFLEALLKKHTFQRFSALTSFLKPDCDAFNKNYIVRMEISEIFSFLRFMNAGDAQEYISSMPSYLVGKTSFDLIAMAKARTRDDLLDVLDGTPYEKIVAACAVNDEGFPDYTLCEVALRTYYYKTLSELAEKSFKGTDKDELQRQIGTQIDLINIINAYRMKEFFGADEESIKQNMFPFSGRIPKSRQYDILSADNGEEFLNLLGKTLYGRQLSKIDGRYFEMRLSKLRLLIAKSDFLNARSSAVCLYCIQYLFDVELKNVITIIEGIRYKRPPTEIAALLVLQ